MDANEKLRQQLDRMAEEVRKKQDDINEELRKLSRVDEEKEEIVKLFKRHSGGQRG